MNKAQETILRISGIIFFLLTIATSLEMLSRAVASWIFMIESESVGWGGHNARRLCIDGSRNGNIHER